MTTLDLRHVASPAVRDLLHLANHPDFDRAQQQIEPSAAAPNPSASTGHTATVDATTGDVLRSYTTANEPTGSLLTACGNRRASRCPACSRLYAADTYHLIRAGLSGGKSVPDDRPRPPPRLRHPHRPLLRPRPQPPHHRGGQASGPAAAATATTRQTPRLGHAAEPGDLRLHGRGAVNAHAGALWAPLHHLPAPRARRRARHDAEGRPNAVLRVSFAKVAEYQQRGLVHFHAVIRLDGPDGSTPPPPAWATVAVLTDAITRRRAGSGSPSTRTPSGHANSPGASSSTYARSPPSAPTPNSPIRRWPRYVAKYATKCADALRHPRPRPVLPPLPGTRRTCAAPRPRSLCTACDGTGQARPAAPASPSPATSGR